MIDIRKLAFTDIDLLAQNVTNDIPGGAISINTCNYTLGNFHSTAHIVERDLMLKVTTKII